MRGNRTPRTGTPKSLLARRFYAVRVERRGRTEGYVRYRVIDGAASYDVAPYEQRFERHTQIEAEEFLLEARQELRGVIEGASLHLELHTVLALGGPMHLD